jgi:membrane associated rhomboid family serine protease
MIELRPQRFQVLPLIVKNLIIINAIFLLLDTALERYGINLSQYLGLHYWSSQFFAPWQLITHLFMHGNFGHLFFNMFALWMFGSIIENIWGPKRFLIFYFVCGLGAALCHLSVLGFEFGAFEPNSRSVFAGIMDQATVGASGAVFGVLFAYGFLFPNTELYIYFLFPIKAKYFVALYAAIELFSGFNNSAGDNVAHFAHLGGMLFAFILLKYWQRNNRQPLY